MAASVREVSGKGVHWIPNPAYRQVKSRQNLWNNTGKKHETSLKWASSSCIFQLFCLDNANILVYFSQFAQNLYLLDLMFSIKNLNFMCIKFRGPVLSQLLVYLISRSFQKIVSFTSVWECVCVCVCVCMCVCVCVCVCMCV